MSAGTVTGLNSEFKHDANSKMNSTHLSSNPLNNPVKK